MKNFLIIPMDDRPCTYNFPKQLGEMYGANIIMPSKLAMGNLERVADIKKIQALIQAKLREIQGIIISSDTLIYGGLIPSRRVSETFEELAKNLLILKEIKKTNPNIPIYVCSTIMRISNSNENQEEKTYWNKYGELIHKYSYMVDQFSITTDHEYDQYIDKLILDPMSHENDVMEVFNQIPKEILRDYIEGRFRNFKINKLLLKWVKEGIIDYLVICADDSSEKGFNVIEKRLLNRTLDKVSGLKEKVCIYPGTDEAISLLLGKMINKKENFIPKFYAKYSKGTRGSFTVTMYEGVPLKETLSNQIKAIGGTLVHSEASADIILYFHTPSEEQEDQYLNAIFKKETKVIPEEIIEADIQNIKKDIDSSKLVLIDIAYANGANHDFMTKLSQTVDIKKLLSFSSWNTTGNSIGTALAHSCIRSITKNRHIKIFEELHYTFLLERFLDDWFYQGFARLEFVRNGKYPFNQEELEKLKEMVEHLSKTFLKLQKGSTLTRNLILEKAELNSVSFPWKRIFEVDISCSVKL